LDRINLYLFVKKLDKAGFNKYCSRDFYQIHAKFYPTSFLQIQLYMQKTLSGIISGFRRKESATSPTI